eukprot:COSAG06_NODE_18535_length_882_cov_4.369093_1_plen_23_part_01
MEVMPGAGSHSAAGAKIKPECAK